MSRREGPPEFDDAEEATGAALERWRLQLLLEQALADEAYFEGRKLACVSSRDSYQPKGAAKGSTDRWRNDPETDWPEADQLQWYKHQGQAQSFRSAWSRARKRAEALEMALVALRAEEI